ncbi:hypothetical protein LPV64_20330, partial [Ralstonia pseudosolanacearum]|nr:hypothetical protein [Ralstonia pseudosolanacearum]
SGGPARLQPGIDEAPGGIDGIPRRADRRPERLADLRADVDQRATVEADGECRPPQPAADPPGPNGDRVVPVFVQLLESDLPIAGRLGIGGRAGSGRIGRR